MSNHRDNRAEQVKPQLPTIAVEATVTESPDTLAKTRADLESTRLLLLQLSVTTLKLAKAYCQCRNCKRVASRFIMCNHREFGTQEIALCDGCDMTPEWKDTGSIRKIVDQNLLEIIRIANEVICSQA